MRVIDHGNDIVEFAGAIKDPHNIIQNMLALDEDEKIHPVMTPFEDWYEGFYDEEKKEFVYEWRKGKKKLVDFSEKTKKAYPEAHKTVSDLIVEPICTPFDECIEIYSGMVGVDYEPASRNLDIRVYDAGEGLSLHADLNYTIQNRYSFVIYLNDDYTGGELIFPEEDVTVFPEAGTIMAFPSLSEHEARAVVSGVKWHIPYFWYLGFGRVMCNKETAW